MTDRKRLLEDGDELLGRITDVAREAAQTTMKARVDRLLESACPAIGHRFMIDIHTAYIWANQADEVWEELFNGEPFTPCGHDDCDYAYPEEDNLQRWFGFGSHIGFVALTDHNVDVLTDPELTPVMPTLGSQLCVIYPRFMLEGPSETEVSLPYRVRRIRRNTVVFDETCAFVWRPAVEGGRVIEMIEGSWVREARIRYLHYHTWNTSLSTPEDSED